MDLDRLTCFVFVLYCTAVGIVLTVIPWTRGWDQMLAHLPFAGARFFELVAVRGGLTGFGLVHLVWAFHDLRQILRAEGSSHDG